MNYAKSEFAALRIRTSESCLSSYGKVLFSVPAVNAECVQPGKLVFRKGASC